MFVGVIDHFWDVVGEHFGHFEYPCQSVSDSNVKQFAETVLTMSLYIDSVCPVADCNTHRPDTVCGVWNGNGLRREPEAMSRPSQINMHCFPGSDQWHVAKFPYQADLCVSRYQFWNPGSWFHQTREIPEGSPAHCRPHCSSVDGGGWTLVRHTAGTGNWGPWSDDLTGTDEWGVDDGSRSDNHWTVAWSGETYNQFLFSYGDCSGWLIATRDAVNGEHYNNAQRDILRSSIQDHAYKALWYNRPTNAEDPWISIRDHDVDDTIIYGENGNDAHISKKNAHGGANVYIRNVRT